MKSLTAAGENKSLTVVGDRKSLVTCGDVRILHDFLGNKENPDDLYWGIKTWEASTREMRSRIFDLLGDNSVGRKFALFEEFSRAWVVCQSTGEFGGSWMVLHRGLKVEVLDSVGSWSLETWF